MRPSLISPLSGRTLSQSSVYASGFVIPCGSLAQVDSSGGALTVFAPANVWPPGDPDACFMVRDAGGAADSDPITIDGNGRLLDGAASFEFATRSGVVLFVLDEESDEWRRVAVPRTAPTAEQPVYFTGDFPSAPDGGGWQTAMDLDFGALPNQSLATNGVHAIGGYNFTREFAANDRAALAIVNGQGLVFQPAVCDYRLGVRTATLLHLPLTELDLPDSFSFESGLRISAYLSAYSCAFTPFTAGQRVIVGIDNGPSWLYAKRVAADFSASNTAYAGSAAHRCRSSDSENATGGANVTLSTNNAITCVLPEIVDALERIVLQGGAASVAGSSVVWPNPRTGLVPRVAQQRAYPTATDIQDVGSLFSALGVVLAATTQNLGSAPVYTVRALRVEYRI